MKLEILKMVLCCIINNIVVRYLHMCSDLNLVFHVLKNGIKKRGKRVGRGISSGKGKTAGRGHKGQKSRSGGLRNPVFEGGQTPIIRKLPKRGFVHYDAHKYIAVKFSVICSIISCLSESGREAVINPNILKEFGVIKRIDSPYKILFSEGLNVSVNISCHAISENARKAIISHSGIISIINGVR